MAPNSNPLLAPSSLEYGVTPFDQIKESHFEPAFDEALRVARERIAAIRAETAKPDFRNTIEALELSGAELDHVSHTFFNLLGTDGTDPMRELAKKVSPKLAAFSNDILLDAELFARVKAVHDSPEAKALTGEKKELLKKSYRNFARNGALLPEDKKGRLREIDGRLSVLVHQFEENVLHSSNSFLMELGAGDLDGLPESVRESLAATAEEKGKKGAWAVTLDAPIFMPFMKYSTRRDLREKLWRAYMSRATGDKWDNRPVLLEIARLRHERAQLLGFRTHAHFVLEERMASSPETVRKFLDRLLQVSRPAAERDLQSLRDYRRKSEGKDEILPWDFAFYSEKLRKEKYRFDEEELRPYFKLENVIDGVFEHAARLYGLSFKERRDLPVYHPEVRAYEVREGANGRYVGVFYADFHPRPTKRNGAWMTNFQEQGLTRTEAGRDTLRPHVSIVCNFTKPVPGKPALLRFDEVRTLFHEFGHALHSLLSDCAYRSLAGTNVYWDFVELPSQLMENWLLEKEGLDLFARHYETGAPIPAELVGKIRAASKYMAGYQSLRQVNFGMLDMAWHATDPASIADVEKHELAATRASTLFEPVPGTMASPSFGHIFAGGYSAGYYSYKWAEVLEADVFELFKEKGIFNREVSEKLKKELLSRGGSDHPMELFKRFRGREPDPDALLRRDGLL